MHYNNLNWDHSICNQLTTDMMKTIIIVSVAHKCKSVINLSYLQLFG